MAPDPRRSLALLGLLLAPAFAGCVLPDADADVLATFYPLGFLATRIAGDNVSVAVVVPEGTDPHDWHHAPRDIQRIANSDLVVAQGLGFEPWLDRVVASLGARAPLVVETAHDLDPDHEPWADHDHAEKDHDASGGTENETGDRPGSDAHADGSHDDPDGAHVDDHDDHGHDHGDTDPHTWLDPVLFAQQAVRIRDAMMHTFPEHADAFAARTDVLLHDIERLHEDFEERLSGCRLSVFVTQHGAFERLAERYDLETASPSGLDPEAEPDLRRLDDIIRLVRDNDIPVVFSEPGADPRIMEAIAGETDATVLELHHLESRTRDERATGIDWFDLMEQNRDRLAQALECD